MIREKIAGPVRLLWPVTLRETKSLARMQEITEERLKAQKRDNRSSKPSGSLQSYFSNISGQNLGYSGGVSSISKNSNDTQFDLKSVNDGSRGFTSGPSNSVMAK